MVTSSGIGAVGDDLADEVEVGLAGRREADLDLLVAHPDQQVEHAPLARRAHRVDQGLVAVAQVHRTPHRCAVDDRVGPGAVKERHAPTPGSARTSSAKVRYRLTGIDVVRWVFQAGWPGLGAPDGLLMVRTDVKASR